MKIVLSSILLVITSLTCYSQSETIDKKLEFGFNLGVNRVNLMIDEAPSLLPSYSGNRFGFDLGILMNYNISKLISFSPQAELSFNKSNVNNYWTGTEYILPTSLGVKAHFQFNLSQSKISPYIICGPSARLDVKNELNYPKPSRNLAIDLGIGLENKYDFFTFSPEIIYSFGLNNVSQTVNDVYYHKLSLVLNFKN